MPSQFKQELDEINELLTKHDITLTPTSSHGVHVDTDYREAMLLRLRALDKDTD